MIIQNFTVTASLAFNGLTRKFFHLSPIEMKALLHNYIVGGLIIILIFRKNGAAAKLNAQNQTHNETKQIVNRDELQEGNYSSLLNEQSQISKESIHKHANTAVDKLDRNKTLFNATKFRLFDATAISYSACEKLDFAVFFVSSLDWEKSFVNISDSEGEMSASIWDIYFLQIILTTVSLGLVMFGTTLLFPACILAACCFGIFSTCYIIENFAIRSVNCQMKLALSTVAGCVAAFFASGLIRFGLFSLGSISFGSGAYFIFDVFPDLDPGDVPVTTTSDLSSIAWVVIVVMGLFGGLIIRYFEQASLEGVTAIMGGIGCAYSVHTFVLIQGGRLDRSFTFLIGIFFSIIGMFCAYISICFPFNTFPIFA